MYESLETSQADLFEQGVQRRLKIYVDNHFSGHGLSWIPNHVRDLENLVLTIPIAYGMQVYFFKEPDREKTDCLNVSGERTLPKSTVTRYEDMKRRRAQYCTEQGEV